MLFSLILRVVKHFGHLLEGKSIKTTRSLRSISKERNAWILHAVYHYFPLSIESKQPRSRYFLRVLVNFMGTRSASQPSVRERP